MNVFLAMLLMFFNVDCFQLDKLLPPLPETQCERITISLCQDLGYNFTVMPNLMGNKSQKEAEQTISIYAPVLTSGCSPHVRFLLCSAFAPLCSEHVSGGVGGCRGLCEQVSESCADALKGLPALNCAKFPDRADRRLCMRPPNASDQYPPPTELPYDDFDTGTFLETICPPSAGGECIPGCGERREDRRRAEAWIAGVAWASLLSTAFASLAFRADRTRFRYPERPIVYAAGCHAVVAVTHLVGAWVGSQCGASGGPACVAFFTATYYFTLAADAWFANACVAWYLSAACEWSTEAVERASAYYHGGAWGWAGAWSGAAVALHQIQPDKLVGTCRIPDETAGALVGVPRGALLGAGVALAFCAACGVRRVRRALGDGGGAKRVTQLAARSGCAAGAYWLLCAGACVAAVCGAVAPWPQCASLAAGAAAGAWAWSAKSWRVCARALRPETRKPPVTVMTPKEARCAVWYPPLMSYDPARISTV